MNSHVEGPATSGEPHAHAHGHDAAHCPQCLASPGKSGSAKIAWTIAIIAVALLVAVYFVGVGSAGGTWLAAAGLPLLALLICPLVMGGMMFMMMRKGH